jgi:hypothetical protein
LDAAKKAFNAVGGEIKEIYLVKGEGGNSISPIQYRVLSVSIIDGSKT